tara:strand:- start:16806 stop:17393 length:588 start_codon:yes stop_codon:yes gene_type:complete
MKKLLLLIPLMIIFSLKTSAVADGRGELQLSSNVISSFINYITGETSKDSKSLFNKPLSFWVTTDGSASYWWFCPYSRCAPGNQSEEKKACERSTGLDCERFARGRYVRWDNGINPKGSKAKFSSKMSANEVRAKLTKLGFFNNNLNSTSETNQTNDVTSSSKSLIEQLDALSKLFDEGKLTEEEFTKLKKKLLE